MISGRETVSAPLRGRSLKLKWRVGVIPGLFHVYTSMLAGQPANSLNTHTHTMRKVMHAVKPGYTRYSRPF